MVILKVLEWLLNAVLFVGNIWLTFLLLYHLYMSIYGFRKEGRTYAPQAPATRFLILVPAHNEEAVIGDMVRHLKGLDYPKELYDFYIIADNCTDRTAQIAREMGASVIENFKEREDSPTGKPLALRKALEVLPGYEQRYDLLMIFDADNLMDDNILSEVNSQYISEGEPEIIQCYLGSKNNEGLVARFFHISFAISNRFVNLSKYRLGLNAGVGGTGFAIRTSYLAERGGWTTMSLTEDFEIQVDVAIRGGRILWNNNVRIYDEKPTNFYAAFRQSTRWAQGRWFVAFRNTPRLMSVWLQGKLPFGEMLSLLTYMYSMAAPIFIILNLLVKGIAMIMPFFYGSALTAAIAAAQSAMNVGRMYNSLLFELLFAALTVVATGYSTFFLYWWAEKMDNNKKVRLREFPQLLASYLVSLVNVSVSQVVGLFKFRQQNKWVKTAHKISERAVPLPTEQKAST